jgi:tetratricopeptide (TPR) repeat protein
MVHCRDCRWLVVVLVAAQEAPTPELRHLFNVFEQHSESGDIEAAAEAMQQATVLNPAFPGAWINLGLAQWDLSQHDAAVESCLHAAELDPLNDDVFVNLGSFFSTMRDPKALDMFNRASMISPKNVETLLALGGEFMRQGRFKDALIAFGKAERLEPEKPEIALQNALVMPMVYTSTAQIELVRRRLVRSIRRLWKVALGKAHPLADASDGTDSIRSKRGSKREQNKRPGNMPNELAPLTLPWNRAEASGMPLIQELNGLTMPAVFDIVYQGYHEDKHLMQALSAAYAMMHPDLITAAPHLLDGFPAAFLPNVIYPPPTATARTAQHDVISGRASEAGSGIGSAAGVGAGRKLTLRVQNQISRRRVRVGFVSSFWFKHSVCKVSAGE